MCFGVVFGMAVVTAQKYNLVDDSNQSNLLSKRPAIALILVSLVGFTAGSAYAVLCPNSVDCDEVHSYTTFIPVSNIILIKLLSDHLSIFFKVLISLLSLQIVSYLVLRNVFGILRSRYSSMFAWFGRISLELCMCQYHIWLAADSHGVLVFVPGYPVLNVLITSFIFVCVAHEVSFKLVNQ